MMDVIAIVCDAASWAAAIAAIAPVLLGTRIGVRPRRCLPFSAEGLLILGAAAAVSTVDGGVHPWSGVGFAVTAGLAIGFVHATLIATLAHSQHITGIAITLLAIGCASAIYALVPATTAAATAPVLVDRMMNIGLHHRSVDPQASRRPPIRARPPPEPPSR